LNFFLVDPYVVLKAIRGIFQKSLRHQSVGQ
jgi:hypothetical protein